MDLKGIVFKTGGALMLTISFVLLFLGIMFVLAPYELDSLRQKVEAEYPAKLAYLMDFATPDQYKNISLNEIRTFCAFRGVLGTANLSTDALGIPLGEKDIDFICDKSSKVGGIAELKELFLSFKLNEVMEDVFPRIKKEYIEPYANAYLPFIFLGAFFTYVLAAAAFYVGEGGALEGLRTLFFQGAVSAGLNVLTFVILWFALPSLMDSMVKGNPQIEQMLSGVPTDMRPAADIFVADTVIFVSEWMKDVMVHLILICGIISAINGALWLGVAAAAAAEKEKQ